jgi:hypothetical protein
MCEATKSPFVLGPWNKHLWELDLPKFRAILLQKLDIEQRKVVSWIRIVGPCHIITQWIGISLELLNGAKKLQAEEAHFPDRVLAKDFGDERRSLTGNKA